MSLSVLPGREIFDVMRSRHEALFTNPSIQNACGSFGSLPAIGMNQYMVSFADKGPLATFGVGPCFAVCMKGRTADDRTLLGLCHTFDTCCAIASVKKAMSELGCLPETIDTKIIGGEMPTKDLSGSLAQEIEILRDAEESHLSGVRFNIAHDEVDLDVVLTDSGVFYSQVEIVDHKLKNKLFTPSRENAGIDLV